MAKREPAGQQGPEGGGAWSRGLMVAAVIAAVAGAATGRVIYSGEQELVSVTGAGPGLISRLPLLAIVK